MSERRELVIRRMVETLLSGMDARQSVVDQRRAQANAVKPGNLPELNPEVVAFLRALPSATTADVMRACRVGKASVDRARQAMSAEARPEQA